MSDTKHSMPSLFRSLRSEPPTATASSASSTEAANPAEQRWPILNSIEPKKFPTSVLLSEEEKVSRRTVQPARLPNAVQSPGSNELSRQLASGLSRMLGQRLSPALDEVAAPIAIVGAPIREPLVMQSVVPSQSTQVHETLDRALVEVNPFRKRQVQATGTPELDAALVQNDNSLQAVFRRLEQAHQPPPAPSPKLPAFLARLGKR